MADRIPHHLIWPGLVILLLAGSLLTGAITISLATGDPSFAIEPDYYDKALAWDQTAEASRQSDALGWTSDLTLSTTQDAIGNRRVTLTLEDASQSPVADAIVRAEAFHQARSADRLALEFESLGNGQYQTTLRAPRAGAWRINLTATRNDRRHIESSRLWVFAPVESGAP